MTETVKTQTYVIGKVISLTRRSNGKTIQGTLDSINPFGLDVVVKIGDQLVGLSKVEEEIVYFEPNQLKLTYRE